MKVHIKLLSVLALTLGLGVALSQSPAPTGKLVIVQTQDPHSWDPIDTAAPTGVYIAYRYIDSRTRWSPNATEAT